MVLAANSGHKMNSAGILCNPLCKLCSIFQNGCNIEAYVEEFLLYSHLVPGDNAMLRHCFWSVLDLEISLNLPREHPSWTLAQFIDFVLQFCGSPFTVMEVEEDPSPKHFWGWAVCIKLRWPSWPPCQSLQPSFPPRQSLQPSWPPRESTAAMAAMPESPAIMATMSESPAVMAATSEPSHVMAAMSEASHVMATTPEPLHIMAIQVSPRDFLEGGYSTQAPVDKAVRVRQ